MSKKKSKISKQKSINTDENTKSAVAAEKISSMTNLLGYVRDINVCVIFLAGSVVAMSYLTLKYNITGRWQGFLLLVAMLIGYLPSIFLYKKSKSELENLYRKKEWGKFGFAIILFLVFFGYFGIVSGFVMYEKIHGLEKLLPS